MDDKLIASNRKAHHDYTILESIEAGVALTGTEVKSVREAKINLKDSYALIDGGQAYLYNMHISPYAFGNIYNVDPVRKRKLLLHKSQIRKYDIQVAQKGFAIIPLKVYIKHGLVKIEIALCKGKKQYDKRDAIKKREERRVIQRAVRDKKGE